MLEAIAATPVGSLPLREPARARPDTLVGDVITAMHEMKRGSTLIEDEAGQVVGIFTERDLMLRSDHVAGDWRRRPVRELMTQKPVSIAASEPLSAAIRRMREGNFRHLPVLDEQGKSAGILSIRDILAHMVEFFPQEFLNLPPDPEHEAKRPWGG